ncbi:MAG: FAD:protein FMN transferase [Gallionellaceae bacterium]|nr:FAD:protein FMN transferase [Gallionellaceae bacterium]
MTEDGRQRTEVLSRLRRAFNKCTAQRTKACPLSSVLCLLIPVLCLLGCAKELLYQEQSYVFGTLVDVTVYGEDETRARQAVNDVMHEFRRLHNMLHAWQPSELSELNAACANGESKAVSPELAALLQDAAQLSAQSGGLFNPAIGGLIKLWGFHADEYKPVQPEQKQIAQWVAANPQMNDITLSPGTSDVTADMAAAAGAKKMIASCRNSAVQLDLGGYAKGYALDRAVSLLRERGIHNALVNIGGNIIALGQHGKRAWRVGIQHPRKSGALAMLELRDGEAIGTSGDYQRYFMLGNVRYCHLIDPRSGYPMQGVQAVTILTRGAHAGTLSDAASKPLFIAGAGGWRAAAAQMNLPEAMLVDAQGNIHLTTGLQKRLEFTDKSITPLVE